MFLVVVTVKPAGTPDVPLMVMSLSVTLLFQLVMLIGTVKLEALAVVVFAPNPFQAPFRLNAKFAQEPKLTRLLPSMLTAEPPFAPPKIQIVPFVFGFRPETGKALPPAI